MADQHPVHVFDVDIPLGSMVMLVVKFWVATVIAAALLGAVGGAAFLMFTYIVAQQ